ncbi:hypothetical protein ABT340_15730 [Streptosporangium sp. NPDC000239]|uniref:hypothetical protein n=1 Tax=Streptosporangium sp. NPDC000239 TaxID=3154248 RepID=UPI003319084E
MFTIKDYITGVRLNRTLTVHGYDNGTTTFTARVSGAAVEMVGTVAVNPEELSQLIDHLIGIYNRHVDNGLVATTKYPTS